MKVIFIFLFLLPLGCSTSQKPIKAQAHQETVDRKAIRQTIRNHKRYISDCYGRTLIKKGNEHLKGTLLVAFDIGPDGKAHSAKVLKERSNLQSSELGQCLIAGLETWDFPVHPKGIDVNVTYPFVFQAQTPARMQKKLDQFQKIKGN